jgi:hypothetical protein
MTLRETMVTDALSVFCNTDDFAQSAVYTKAAGGTRTINAVVIRDGYESDANTGQEAPVFEVHVANSATSGISSSELRVGQDTLTFAERIGKTATLRTITRLMSHDEGMLVLECR